MIPLQVFISGLILLLPGAVDSYTVVQGLLGHPVTLPCTYSTHDGGIVPACWGRGECRYSYCSRTLIWTNGYKLTHQRSNRYQLKGHISEGNVSLTIENTVESDGGPYCCIVEIPGAFSFVDHLLEVKSEISTSPPTRPAATGRPTATRPTTTGRPTTISTGSTQVPTTSSRISTSTIPTPEHTQTHKPGAVDSYTVVQGLLGHPVTLPCTYSTYHGGIVPACWGRGECRYSYCSRTLIWTNGYKVTYQRSNRYQLKGHISEGNVSLTIENTVESDGGPYCCIVEIPGAFSFVDYLLEVKSEISTSPPTRPAATGRLTATRPTTTGRPTTISTGSTQVPTTSSRISTSTIPTTENTQTHKPEPTTFYPYQTTAEMTETPPYTPADWNNTVTSSDNSWNNNTEAIPPREPQRTLPKGLYAGVGTAALLLLLLVSAVVITRHMIMKKKTSSLSFVAFPVSKIGASQKKVEEPARGEDMVYIIEDSPYPEEES